MTATTLKRAADLQPGDYIVRDPKHWNRLFYAGTVTAIKPVAVTLEEDWVRIEQQGKGWFQRPESYELEVRTTTAEEK